MLTPNQNHYGIEINRGWQSKSNHIAPCLCINTVQYSASPPVSNFRCSALLNCKSDSTLTQSNKAPGCAHAQSTGTQSERENKKPPCPFRHTAGSTRAISLNKHQRSPKWMRDIELGIVLCFPWALAMLVFVCFDRFCGVGGARGLWVL